MPWSLLCIFYLECGGNQSRETNGKYCSVSAWGMEIGWFASNGEAAEIQVWWVRLLFSSLLPGMVRKNWSFEMKFVWLKDFWQKAACTGTVISAAISSTWKMSHVDFGFRFFNAQRCYFFLAVSVTLGLVGRSLKNHLSSSSPTCTGGW